MTWLDTLRSAWEAILGHRLRSVLTMLGILIGIAAVILTVGLGEGAQAKVTSAISALGSNLLIVSPGSSTTGGVRGGFGSASTLTLADATALSYRPGLPNVAAVAPIVQRNEALTAGSSSWTAPVIGSTPAWMQVEGRHLALGSFFDQAQVDSAQPVAVLGITVASELFPGSQPVGQTVDINGKPFTVVGVLTSAGSSTSSNQDDQLVVPVSAAQQLLFGGSSSSSVQSILISADSGSTLGAAYQEVEDDLLNLHHITNPGAADFTITTQSTIISTATSVSKTLTVLLGGVAGISLLVGGIGIMNIMLVSVTERVREIGLRKALGATPAAIRRQFLVEASALSLAGGVIGLGLALIGAIELPGVLSDPITIPVWAAVGAVAVAVAIGLGFGVYPASRAARLAPIDALRSE